MAKFAWVAVNAEGAILRGSSVAADSREVAERVREQGFSVVAVRRRKWPPTNLHLERLSRRDIIDFTYKLTPLLASGLPMQRTLEILRGEVKKYRIKNALVSMKQGVNSGASLSYTMAKHPDVFSMAYVSAVRAGEESGQLDKALAMMGSFLEWLDDVIKQIWAVVSYPLLVVFALGVLTSVLAFFAIPTFMQLYGELGMEIDVPLPTRIVFGFSWFMVHYWYVIALVLAAAIAIFLLRKTWPRLHMWFHRLYLRVPYLGDITRRLQSLQFCRYFHMLYENGVEVKRALAEAQGVLTNLVMAQAVDSISRRLEEGVSLADAFEMSGQFPSLVGEQLRVGEESGNVGESLAYIIRYYDAELDYSIRRFTTFLRPALVTVLAFVLLILALAFYMPLFEVVNLID